MMRTTALSLLLGGLILAGLAGCSTTPTIDASVVERVQACIGPEHAPHLTARRIDGEVILNVAGSGTFIAPGLLVTCAHVVLEPRDDLFVNGLPLTSITLARGNVPPTPRGKIPEINKPQFNSDEADYDWMIIGVDPSVTPQPLPYIVDRFYRPTPGQTIVLAGRPIGDLRLTSGGYLAVTDFVLVPAMVLEQPPEEVRHGAFVSVAPVRFGLTGMSGGPALAYDPARSAIVLFGIATASVTQEAFGIAVDRYAVVRTLSFLNEAAGISPPPNPADPHGTQRPVLAPSSPNR